MASILSRPQCVKIWVENAYMLFLYGIMYHIGLQNTAITTAETKYDNIEILCIFVLWDLYLQTISYENLRISDPQCLKLFASHSPIPGLLQVVQVVMDGYNVSVSHMAVPFWYNIRILQIYCYITLSTSREQILEQNHFRDHHIVISILGLGCCPCSFQWNSWQTISHVWNDNFNDVENTLIIIMSV